jgi:hypothetical protein
MNYLKIALVGSLALLPAFALAQTPSPSSAAGAAVKAMNVYEMQAGHLGTQIGMKNQACRVVQDWAKCSFEDSSANSVAGVIMERKSGSWTFVWQYGGVAAATDLEKHGVPASIAKQFVALDS